MATGKNQSVETVSTAIDSFVIVKYNNKESVAKIISNDNGKLRLSTFPVVAGKAFWKESELLRNASIVEIQRFQQGMNSLAGNNGKGETNMVKATTTAPKTEKPAKKEEKKPQELTQLMKHSNPGTVFEVPLSSLVDIRDTSIKNGAQGARPINQEHLTRLINVDDDNAFPPFEVVLTNQGNVVLGGYHRWNRLIARGMVEYYRRTHNIDLWKDENGKDQEIDKTVMDALSQSLKSEQTNVNNFIGNLKARVIYHNFDNEVDAVIFALTDNSRHGMPMDKTAKSKLGMLLVQEKGMSLRVAARYAGVSHQAIADYMNAPSRVKEVKEKAAKGEVSQEVAAEVEKQQKEKAAEDLLKNFSKSLRAIYPTLESGQVEACVLYLKDVFKATDAPMLSTTATILHALAVDLSKEAGK